MPFVDHPRTSLLTVLLCLLAPLCPNQAKSQNLKLKQSSNPYNLILAAEEKNLESVPPAQAAVLLERIHNLFDYVDAPEGITAFLGRVANDSRQNPLIRRVALHYLNPESSAIPSMHLDELIRSAQQAVDADGDSAIAHETLAELERIHGDNGYIDEFEKAALIDPTAARWSSVAQSCAIQSCEFSALQHALQIDPSDPKANSLLAGYYVERHQLENARRPLEVAAASAPSDFVIQKQLADFEWSTGNRRKALEQYGRLEDQFPAPRWMRRELGLTYAGLSLFSKATQLLEPLGAERPDDKPVYEALKMIYQRTQDSTRLRTLEHVQLSSSAPASDAANTLAKLDAADGDVQAAIQSMKTLVTERPNDADLRESLAYLYGSSGNEPEYRKQLSKAAAVSAHPEAIRQQLHFADAHDTNNDPDQKYFASIPQLIQNVRESVPADNANVISLANTTVERVRANGQSSQHTQLVLLINSDAGASDFSTYRVQYSNSLQKLDVIAARIHKQDGRLIPAENGGESGYADAAVSMYYDTRQRILEFPQLAKGDIMEIEYRISPRTASNAYGNYFGGLFTFQSSMPEKLRRYVLVAPASEKLNISESRMPAPIVGREGPLRTYAWEVRNMPPLHTEPRGPSLTETAPYVNVSTFDSWQSLGRWYAGFIAPQLKLDTPLRAALEKITYDKATDLEKIRAIHKFVIENTHYVGLEFGVYSYKPYPVSQVYARGFGDCKDKASLMVSLMRAAGIEADFALVRTRKLGDVENDATSLQIFDHAIVYVPKYDLWLDGTAEYAGLRELPLDDQGAMALTVGADGDAQMRRVPGTLPMENYTHRVVRASLKNDGTIVFSGSAYTRGEDAPGLRREFETSDRQRDTLRANLAQVYPAVRVDSVHVEGTDDVERDINFNFAGSIDTFAGSHTLSLVSSWMPHKYTETLASLSARTQDLRLPAPWTTEEELHFALPQGASFESIPKATTLKTPYGTAVLRYEHRDHELVVSTSVQFSKLRITPAEYPAFRQFCQQVERAFHAEIKVRLAS